MPRVARPLHDSARIAFSFTADGRTLFRMNRNSRLSLWSVDSVLSIGSRGSVLSVGSVGSALSIGSIGSFGSVLAIGSALSMVAVLSWLSIGAVMSSRSRIATDQKLRSWRPGAG